MGELYQLNLDRLIKVLGLKENFERELRDDGILATVDITQFVDVPAGTVLPSPKYGGGRLTQIAVPQPPINVDPTPIVVPAGTRWLFRGWTGVLLTGAVVGNRQVGVQIINGNGIIQAMYMDNVTPFQPANRSDQYFFHQPGGQNTFVPTVNFHSIPCGYGDAIHLKAGWQVGTKTQGIQAGDSWQANIFLIVEEFLDTTATSTYTGPGTVT